MAKSKTTDEKNLALNLGKILQQFGEGKEPIDWASIEMPIEHSGRKIVLPSEPTNMDIPSALEMLTRVMVAENQEYDIFEHIPCAPWDGLVAVYRALQELYGLVSPQSEQRFFFGQKVEIRPDMVSVRVGWGDKDVISVPHGDMLPPNFDKPITIKMVPSGVVIKTVQKKRHRSEILDIVAKAREILRTKSVYRGKAIRLGVKQDGSLELDRQPEFLNLTHVSEDDIIHTKDTSDMIRINIFAPLKKTNEARKNRVPLKRGILLEGKYGTGKSLTALVTAKVAIDNGWTFIMLDRSHGLKTAIEFAKNYQPCVIFAEDIDRAADRQKESTNDLINLLDGAISKDMEMMVVLTTNFIELIDKSLLRPGRFDAIINIQSPDEETVSRLISVYARNLLADDTSLEDVPTLLKGQIPATIREVVERAKLSMLIDDRPTMDVTDLKVAARSMLGHMELLNGTKKPLTKEENLWNAFSELFKSRDEQLNWVMRAIYTGSENAPPLVE